MRRGKPAKVCAQRCGFAHFSALGLSLRFQAQQPNSSREEFERRHEGSRKRAFYCLLGGLLLAGSTLGSILTRKGTHISLSAVAKQARWQKDA